MSCLSNYLPKRITINVLICRQKKIKLLQIYIFLALCLLTGCNVITDPGDVEMERVEEKAEKVVEEAEIDDVALLEEGNFVIGILQFMEHQALDDTRAGILDAMELEGLIQGSNLKVIYENALGDQTACYLIADNFVQDNVDLIIAIATPAAQAAASAVQFRDIPVIFAAVTEPYAAGVVDDWDKPGVSVTGVSDLTPVRALMEMALEIMPDTENIGVVYNDEEINSVVQVILSREAAAELGVTIVESVANHRDQVMPAAEDLAGQVDVIWTPTDNLILEAFDSIYQVMKESRVPVIGASTQFAAQGALCATGFEYYDLGIQAGAMVVEALRGADPALTPVQQPTEILIAINLQAAEHIGYRIPFELMLMADNIYTGNEK